MIHPSAIVDKDAQIHPSVEIGPFTIIGKGVVIDKGTIIGAHSFIEYSTIGSNCKIYHSVCIGTPPQDFKYRDKKTDVKIGDGCTIREFATIHRASITDTTIIGNNCYMMAYSHVAHDCILGNNVVMATGAFLGGHVHVEDNAIIGGLVAIHQFVNIGEMSILGGGTIATQDVLPYMLACGDRAKLFGLNLVGLKRNNVSGESIKKIKTAYRILFLSKKPFTQAVKELERINSIEPDEKVTHILDFIKKTKRGICHP